MKNYPEKSNRAEEEETSWLVCMPVKGFQPKLISWKDKCSRCGAEVWRADQVEFMKVICMNCADEMMKDKDEVNVMLPTKEQIAKIINVLTRVKS